MTRERVVFPMPAGPAKRTWGMFFCLTKASSLFTISCCPLTSAKVLGLNFSVHMACSMVLFSERKSTL